MSLGDAIEYYLRSTKMYGRYQEQEVVRLWPEVMGETIARKTTDIQMKSGVLHVRLDSAVLRKEMEMNREKVVRMMNEAMGAQLINTVKFF